MSDLCPLCGADLQGDPIPVDLLSFYNETHYSNRIGVEIPGIYDGVLYWLCSECHGAWQRWAEGSPLAGRAAPWIEKNNTRGDHRDSPSL